MRFIADTVSRIVLYCARAALLFLYFFYFPYYGLIMHYILLLHLIFVMVHIFISPDLYIPDKQFHPLSFLALLFNPGCWILPNNKLTHNTNVLLSRKLSAFKLWYDATTLSSPEFTNFLMGKNLSSKLQQHDILFRL